MAKAIIDQLGGEERVRELVERFYDIIETHPLGEDILRLHFDGHGLLHVRIEQFNFLSGFFGGRNYFKERHGHMNLRQLHAHVPIRPIDAENWLKCMDMAIDDVGLTGDAVPRIRETFRRAALALVNVEE